MLTLIDRYIISRTLANFLILFLLVFMFAVSIDVIVALDRFVDATNRIVGKDATSIAFATTFLRITADFQLPRFFQFYAYLHGLAAIGAMGFTLAQMHRHRELIALLSAGVSFVRVALPFVIVMFALSVLQLLNQELILPRVAPLLIREYAHIGMRSVEQFPVPLTPDANGNLLQAPVFDPDTGTLEDVTILDRDERGRTRRRLTAPSAKWDETAQAWTFVNGRALTLREDESGSLQAGGAAAEVIDYPTDLSPRVLLVHRYGQFATMLSLRQIQQMIATPGIVARDALVRHRYARFATVIINVLVMWLALPAFLVRGPANLMSRSIYCAVVALPALMGSAVFLVVDLPGIAPAAGVFLPVAVLVPVVLAQWSTVKT